MRRPSHRSLLAVTLAGVAAATVCFAASSEMTRIFSEGNDHYAKGEFEEAVKDYRQLLNQGFRSGAIHYNLGNALYKTGQLGPAILEYEKAALAAPEDPDVLANLEFVRSLTADKATEAGARTTSFFVERLLTLTTLDQDAWVLAGLFAAMGTLVAVRIAAAGASARRFALWGIAALSLPLAAAAGGYGVKLYRAATTTHAIVLAERLDVRSGPGEENTTLFTMHEGLKVRVRETRGSWFQVSLDNGLNGWVPASALGVI